MQYSQQPLRGTKSTLPFTSLNYMILVLLLLMYQSNSQLQLTTYDGVSEDLKPSFILLDGTNGVKAPIAPVDPSKNLDYFVKMWIRSTLDVNELLLSNQTIFDVPGKLKCAFEAINRIECSTARKQEGVSLDVSDLKYYQWMHLAFAGSKSQGVSYIRLDYMNEAFRAMSTTYMRISFYSDEFDAYLGIDSLGQNGFIGHIREFLYSDRFYSMDQVPKIRNQIMLFSNEYIAYYRLNNGNLLDNQRYYEASYLFSNETEVLPEVVWENMPNDMCYPFFDKIETPNMDISNNLIERHVTYEQFDQRLNYESNDFKYSFSIWLKRVPGGVTALSPFKVNKWDFLFQFDGVFSLWYPDNNTIGAYIYSKANYYDNYTDPLPFPINEWGNFQIIISQQEGFFVKIYNMQRQELYSAEYHDYLAEQEPNGDMIINNAKGFIRSILLYQIDTGFPVIPTYGADGKLESSKDLLCYYIFERQYFEDKLLYAQNEDPKYGALPPLNFTIDFIFVEETFLNDDSYYENPSTLGTLSQSTSLYDGVACEDSHYSIQSSSTTSYITYEMETVKERIGEMTVEFWFKRDIRMDDKHTLFTIYDRESESTFMTIYQDIDHNLKCEPSSSKNIDGEPVIVSATNYNANYLGWQHVACAYGSRNEVALQLDTEDLDQFFYAQNIFSNNIYIATSETYSIVIGNNFTLDNGAEQTTFKEVRVWFKKQSSEEILKFLNQKVDPVFYPELQYYFQMVSGEKTIKNFQKYDIITEVVTNETIVVTTNDTNTTEYVVETTVTDNQDKIANYSELNLVSNPTSIVCPLYSYFNEYSREGCSRSPFAEAKIHLFAEKMGRAPYLRYRISPVFSHFVNNEDTENLIYSWLVQDSNIQSLYVVPQQDQQEIYFERYELTENQPYNFELMMYNSYYLFMERFYFTMIPVSCRYLADVDTKDTVNTFIYYREPTSQGITLQFQEFQPRSSSSCSSSTDFFNIQGDFSYDVWPVEYEPTGIVSSYDSSTGVFQIDISAESLSSLPYEQYLNIVGSVDWTDSEGTSYSLSVAYRIMFAYDITPSLSNSYSNVLVGKQLFLDGSESAVPALETVGQSVVGLSYQWDCESIFSTTCTDYYNIKYLKVKYQDFLDGGGEYDVPYVFTLGVWRATNYDSSARFTQDITIYWRDVEVPDYTINLSGDFVLATSDNVFYLDIFNYPSTDKNLQITWSFDPPLNDPDNTLVMSQDDSVVTIKAGGVTFSTQYVITVEALNLRYPDESLNTQTYAFSVGSPPENGTASVNPETGAFMSTKFYFQIDAWESANTPVVFKVYGQQNSQSSQIELTTRWYDQSEMFVTTLPSMTQVEFEITDMGQETVNIIKDLMVVIPEDYDFEGLIETVSADTDIVSKYNDFSSIANELNFQYQENGLEVITFKQQIMDEMNRDLQYIESYNTSAAALELIIAANQVLPSILSDFDTVDDSVVSSANTALQKIAISPTLFSQALAEEGFADSYAESLAFLLNYSNTKGSTSNRGLQSTSFEQLDILSNIQTYADLICYTMTTAKKFVTTDIYELSFEKFEVSTTIQTSSHVTKDSQYELILPVQDLINKSIETYGSNFTYICAIGNFFYLDILQGQEYTNQTQFVAIQLLPSTVDNMGNHLLQNGSMFNLTTYFESAFYYNFSDPALDFVNNQTMCMNINEGTASDEGSKWGLDYCDTEYIFESNVILCDCSSLENNLYGIVNDYSRIPILPPENITVIDETVPPEPYEYYFYGHFSFNAEILLIVILLTTLEIVLPVLAIFNDKADQQDLVDEENDHIIDDETLNKIAIRNELPEELVFYRQKLFRQLFTYDKLSCNATFTLFLKYLHPLFNIHFKFDILNPRLLRFLLLSFQLSLITLVVVLVFGTSYRSSEFISSRNNLDEIDQKYALITGILLSFLTLPLPYVMIQCLYLKYNKEHDEERSRARKTGKEESDDERKGPEDHYNPGTNQRMNSQDVEGDDGTRDKIKTQKDKELLQDSNQAVKIILLGLSQSFMIAMIVYVCIVSGKIPRANALIMVTSWLVAFVVGYLIINLIKVLILALIVPGIVEQEENNEGVLSGCSKILDCLMVPVEAKELYSDFKFIQMLRFQGNDEGEKSEGKKPAIKKNSRKDDDDDDEEEVEEAKQDTNEKFKQGRSEEKVPDQQHSEHSNHSSDPQIEAKVDKQPQQRESTPKKVSKFTNRRKRFEVDEVEQEETPHQQEEESTRKKQKVKEEKAKIKQDLRFMQDDSSDNGKQNLQNQSDSMSDNQV